MNKLSVIIPSRNELFLPQTINDLLTKANGEVEVIAVLDGYWPSQDTPNFNWELWLSLLTNKNLIVLHKGRSYGMRSAINSASAIARGKYLMKTDAHCMFAEGYDDALKADCDGDWLVIPRRKRLDPANWIIEDSGGRPDIDYEFLSYPFWKPEEPGVHGTIWNERIRERKDVLVDEDMSFQGSCWFITKDYYDKVVGSLQEEGYGTFIGEPQEVGLKVWLSGGTQVRNKKTWYAHLHKGSRWGRGYSVNRPELKAGNLYSVDYWYNNRWPKRTRDIEWLVDHFWPVPTWPSKDRTEWKPLNTS